MCNLTNKKSELSQLTFFIENQFVEKITLSLLDRTAAARTASGGAAEKMRAGKYTTII